MKDFVLDAHLERECFALGRLHNCRLLLMNNAAVPWFLVVPETSTIEVYELEPSTHNDIIAAIRKLSLFIKAHFAATKINVASIGNIVPQMHWHVVGRRPDDYCWPGVVWGTQPPARYTTTRVDEIRALVAAHCLG